MKGAFIEYWDGCWVTSRLDVVITVNKAYLILIRLRPSIQALMDCPGLKEQLKRQPQAPIYLHFLVRPLLEPLRVQNRS